jgi:hypothetical protein
MGVTGWIVFIGCNCNYHLLLLLPHMGEEGRKEGRQKKKKTRKFNVLEYDNTVMGKTNTIQSYRTK